jgi:hypothetical protein
MSLLITACFSPLFNSNQRSTCHIQLTLFLVLGAWHRCVSFSVGTTYIDTCAVISHFVSCGSSQSGHIHSGNHYSNHGIPGVYIRRLLLRHVVWWPLERLTAGMQPPYRRNPLLERSPLSNHSAMEPLRANPLQIPRHISRIYTFQSSMSRRLRFLQVPDFPQRVPWTLFPR